MISNLKDQVKDLKEAVDQNENTFISKDTFEAVTLAWKDSLKELQRDLRDIKRLLIVGSRGDNRGIDE